MINKISASPAFTSKVRVVYDGDFGLQHFYNSGEMSKQLHKLHTNDEYDYVTLTPVRGRYADLGGFDVQVMQFKDGKGFYTSNFITEPEQIAQAYESAKLKLNTQPEMCESVRNNIEPSVMRFII